METLGRQVGAPDATGALWRARGEAIQYSFSPGDDGPGVTRPYVDLGHFAGKVAAFSPDAAVKSQAKALDTAVKALVIAKSVGSQRTDASAVSVYFPTHQKTVPDAELLTRYAGLSMNAGGGWLAFERAWTKAVRADTTPPQLKNVAMTATNKDGSGHFEFTTAGADVYAAMASLYQVLGKGQYLDFGDVYYTRLVGGDYEFDWQPQAWSVNDGKVATYVTADHSEPGDDYLTAFAEYTPPGGDPFNVRVQFTEDGEVFGVLDDSGDVPIGIEVERGGTLRFYVRSYDEQSEKYSFEPQDDLLKITKDDLSNFKAELADLPNGQFELDFTVFDYAGNDATESVDVEVK